MCEQSRLAFEARMRETIGVEGGPQKSWDPVNTAMIRHWCDAMGDKNPIYTDPEFARNTVHDGTVAPPTMIQAWTMHGYTDKRATGSVERTSENPYVLHLLDEEGFTSVVAVNCDQEYFRYVRPGDDIYHTMAIESISDRKETGLGTGYFVTELWTFRDQNDEKVAEMRFRTLKFKPPVVEGKVEGSVEDEAKAEPAPAEEPAAKIPPKPRPGINRDNAFFWEGMKQGKLLIQRCQSCNTLRHPPAPMCPTCQSMEHDAVEASGNGVIHSFVNMHYPNLPYFDTPNPVALVELEEGTRLIGRLVGIAPDQVKIGMPVKAEITSYDDSDGDPLTVALFRPVEQAQ